MYIAITRKSGEDRTASDWQYMREYEAEHREEWPGFSDPEKDDGIAAENARLHKEVLALRTEVQRLTQMLHEERKRNGLEKPKPSLQEKIDATVEAMRKSGANEADIEEFKKGQAA